MREEMAHERRGARGVAHEERHDRVGALRGSRSRAAPGRRGIAGSSRRGGRAGPCRPGRRGCSTAVFAAAASAGRDRIRVDVDRRRLAQEVDEAGGAGDVAAVDAERLAEGPDEDVRRARAGVPPPYLGPFPPNAPTPWESSTITTTFSGKRGVVLARDLEDCRQRRAVAAHREDAVGDTSARLQPPASVTSLRRGVELGDVVVPVDPLLLRARDSLIALMMQLWFSSSETSAVSSVTSGVKTPSMVA